jgi:hypothetical protein
MNRFPLFSAGVVLLSASLLAVPVMAGVPASSGAETQPHLLTAVLHSPVNGTAHSVAVMPVADRDVRHAEARGHFDRRDADRGDFDGGFGAGLGWGWGNPYWGWGPGWGWGYGPAYGYDDTGGLRLEIKGPNPNKADVYVNGGYVGVVNDFNSWWQSLSLTPGTYGISIDAKGYQPLNFKVTIAPGQTVTYRGDLVPLA